MADKPCTALVRYEPREFVMLRMQAVGMNGHTFRRVAGWLCACGMRRPAHYILGDVPQCTALPD